MGIIRKTMSLSTGGVVSFRNNREKLVRAQKKSAAAQEAQAQAQHAQAAAAARHATAAEVQAEAVYWATTAPLPQMEPPAGPQISVADELLKFQRLRESGALTDAEFEIEKARLLGHPPPPAFMSPPPSVPPPPPPPRS